MLVKSKRRLNKKSIKLSRTPRNVCTKKCKLVECRTLSFTIAGKDFEEGLVHIGIVANTALIEFMIMVVIRIIDTGTICIRKISHKSDVLRNRNSGLNINAVANLERTLKFACIL